MTVVGTVVVVVVTVVVVVVTVSDRVLCCVGSRGSGPPLLHRSAPAGRATGLLLLRFILDQRYVFRV